MGYRKNGSRLRGADCQLGYNRKWREERRVFRNQDSRSVRSERERGSAVTIMEQRSVQYGLGENTAQRRKRVGRGSGQALARGPLS